MKFARLVWANLLRNKRRSLLTILSVAVALFLFALLRSVLSLFETAKEVGSETRLVTRNSVSIIFPVPQSYFERLHAVPGVDAVSWASWFGGQYINERNFFASFAIDPDTYFAMYPEIEVPPDQMRAFRAERTAALVGRDLMSRFGWKLGQTVTLKGTIYPGDWPFTIRGVYRSTSPSYDEQSLHFQYDYLYEKSDRQAEPGWYILKVSDPELAPAVAQRVDRMFENSAAPTKTETEKAFQAGFITMYGNIGFLLNTVGLAIFFAILLVAVNTMIMAARERTGETAVLKALGYNDRLLFGLVLAEAMIITLLGGLLGVLGAKLAFDATGFEGGGMLPGFTIRWSTMAQGLAIALALGLVSGLVPAWQAARLSVVQALRRVA